MKESDADKRKYKADCTGCRISQRKNKNVKERGGIIELDGNWILNHYGSGEGFLGWLSLQPKDHILSLTDLSKNQVKSFISNIQNIDKGLRKFWSKNFKKDPIELVYMVYFFESLFEKGPDSYHLHMHLIPRPKSFRKLKIFSDVKCNTKSGNVIVEKITTEPIGWRIYLASKCSNFPPKYRVPKDKVGNNRAKKLMEFLRKTLPKNDC